MRLHVRGTVATGQVRLDTAITDLEYINGPNGPVLVSVAGPEGGVATFQLREDRLPLQGDQVFYSANQVSGAGHGLVVSDNGGTIRLYATGFNQNGVVRYSLGTGGTLGGRTVLQGADLDAAPAVAALTPGGDMLLADPGQSGFVVHDIGTSSLGSGYSVADTAATHADAIGAAAATRIGSTDIVIVGSTTEHGVTAYTLGNGTAQAADSVGPAEGLGIMVPTDIAIAETSHGTYVIVASEPSNGESGALSVMRLDAQGHLTPTDHVLDTRDSRFGNVQTVATVTHDGHTYVVAAGGDGGVTLLELLPNGRLIHIDSLEGTAGAPLGDVTALELAVVGDELQVFAATEGDAGVTVLTADLSSQGSLLVAENGGDTITGAGQDDILLDGNGADRLEGRGGADRYVLIADGQTDTIVGFAPAVDTLDLTALPFLYDVSRLDIVSTSTGARITYRGETILLESVGGGPLSPESVRAAIEVKISSSFYVPARNIEGSTGADMLMGDWGPDTLKGNDGNDTLNGQDGDDQLLGGRGNDHISGMLGADMLQGGRGLDTIIGGDGADTIFGGSDNDLLLGQAGNDDIYGQGENDTLAGAAGSDTLHGDFGNDQLGGGNANDSLWGGDGADKLSGDNGADTLFGDAGNDALFGNSGGDILSGGIGADTLSGNNGADTLFGDEGNDLLNGNSGFDELNGGDGDDTLLGANSADTLNGGAGHDHLSGGVGFDSLSGDAGNDTLVGQSGADTMRGGDGADLLQGNEGSDHLYGGNGADLVYGHNGNDYARGGNQGDTLFGNNGEDTIFGDAGADRLEGGYSADTLWGGPGNDTLMGQMGPDRVNGGDDDDVVNGDNGNDTLTGGNGNDRLDGGYARDQLDGGAGQDTLLGGTANDTLTGGAGNDVLTGGPGRDEFQFNSNTATGQDTITDFQNGTDIIRIDGAVGYNDLSVRQDGGDTVISWDNGSVTLEDMTGPIDDDDFIFG